MSSTKATWISDPSDWRTSLMGGVRPCVHFSQWTSLDAARAFFESPQLVEIRRIAGVRAPEFRYLKQIEARTL
ncbi:hypothetical protein [Sphingobium baderi]|uniref:hypothetical protein n=1 Tax=Sphingobium baderi TaxID=1332080 RepID=UPI002B415805|nr:hypothetical protein [Sphingobium baderi]WRD75830.1 hypothetical protein QQ987_13690 [Sphingobium baderi]